MRPPKEDHTSGGGAGGTSAEEWTSDDCEVINLNQGSSDSPARGQAWSALTQEAGAAQDGATPLEPDTRRATPSGTFCQASQADKTRKKEIPPVWS